MSTARVVGWTPRGAVAFVDDVRVRIVRTKSRDRWLCDACGDRDGLGHCSHTQAVADTPADPAKFSPLMRRTRPRAPRERNPR